MANRAARGAVQASDDQVDAEVIAVLPGPCRSDGLENSGADLINPRGLAARIGWRGEYG